MSAHDLGKKLLAEVEEIRLDEVSLDFAHSNAELTGREAI